MKTYSGLSGPFILHPTSTYAYSQNFTKKIRCVHLISFCSAKLS